MVKPKGYLHVDGLIKQYDTRMVLDGIDLEIKEGEFVAIVGKSGCGKSTLLRLIAGLEEVGSGSIKIKNVPLTGLNKNARIMFQDGRLLPWLRILDNVGLGLTGDWRPAALKALTSVGLEDRANDWPSKLSGGQKQRVALARALVHQPELLLLDEPLGALDALTRIEMQDLVETLWRNNGFTSILVTHDVEEAVAIADRVILIEDGKIVMDRHIDLPRPRQRAQVAFNTYVDDILQRILKANYRNLRVVKKS
jgi:sulfonate transport system ATP-binding protein